MPRIILFTICALLSIAIQAQKTFFEAIEANGENAIYEGFTDLSPNGGGTCNFGRSLPKVKVRILRISGGIPVGFIGKPVSKDWGEIGLTAISDYGRMDNYPNTMSMKHTHTKDGYIIVDDIIFVLDNIPDKGLPSVNNITKVYALVKNGKTTNSKKKKKSGFLVRMKKKLNKAGLSPTHKYLKNVNLVKKFTNYVKAMQAKQTSYILTSKDKKGIAKIKEVRNTGDAEIKRYNDSIRKTPAYKKLKAHQARMAKMDRKASKTKVTFYNKTGRDIYVYKTGSKNSTTIRVNSSSRFDCSYSYSYKFNPNSGGSGAQLYNANSGCAKSVTVK